MSAFIVRLDQAIFFFVNHGWACGPCDAAFTVITAKAFYLGVAAAAFFLLPAQYRKAGWYAALTAVVAVAIADVTVARWLKPWFHRPRPCYALTGVRLLVPQGDTLAFPSSHAANGFAFATVTLFYYRRWGVALAALAAAVAASRVYVGVHYPLDVVAGAAWGVFIGVVVVSGRFYIDAVARRWLYLRARGRRRATQTK
jgi:undecaprenyl-diphosphatase